MITNERVAPVTGGSSGIGRGIAEALADEGLAVVNADVQRRPVEAERYDVDSEEPTDELLSRVYGTPAMYVDCDVSTETAAREAVDRTVEEFGRLDVLVNNAGVHVPGTSQESTMQDWNDVLDVNLTGAYRLSKRSIPHLRESDAGRIVNIASVYGRFGGAGPGYTTSKGGLLNLTRDLAVELAADGVTVNAVLPGVIKTAIQDANDDETMQAEIDETPMDRIGAPADVAHVVRFLVDERAEWITGAEIVVDGGLTAGL
jgi:NAD(P)-dependent dehydrogenase (short-subunit alcohol dehydrogenase family)